MPSVLLSSDSPSIDNTLGAVVIGGLMSMALWGMTCLQTWDFFTENSRDKRPFRLLGHSYYQTYHNIKIEYRVMDTVDTTMICHAVYYYTVSNHLSPVAIAFLTWSFWVHSATTLVGNTIIRGLFTVRIYHLSHFNIASTVWILLSVDFFFLIAVAIAKGVPSIATFVGLDQISIKNQIFNIFTFLRTNSILKTLMLHAINSNSIVILVMPDNLIFIVYLSAYLASLNARQKLRKQVVDKPAAVHLSDLGLRPGINSTSLPVHNSISVETIIDHDQKE
ncbi:hypothetical protein K435DRAFT_801876 [Dendrothele bispora CBS 962.96]|uniref:Uncharacterized protein n=1 Tax=Dendrothele bispora (strain CBS 962.96) TaxID=1314807 RepID=A0A4S8LND6_DENBC|nr:hypothetical protein K435DRAFT_801876 [Dendrothele bispora CBS 962.96]